RRQWSGMARGAIGAGGRRALAADHDRRIRREERVAPQSIGIARAVEEEQVGEPSEARAAFDRIRNGNELLYEGRGHWGVGSPLGASRRRERCVSRTCSDFTSSGGVR